MSLSRSPIADLPPFTPRLEGFRQEEFHRQSLALLEFPIGHDEAALDRAPFVIQHFEKPSEPLLPALAHVWYARPTQKVRDWVLGQLIPPSSPNVVGKTRLNQGNQAVRLVVGGSGPIFLQGEAGMGKTTLLAYIANHERTRQRYRRIWWLDNPWRAMQGLALALNVPQALSRDEQGFIELVKPLITENTLLVVDNITLEQVDFFRRLSPHIVVGVEIPSDASEMEVPILPPSETVITLEPLDKGDAFELIAEVCGVTDKKAIRGQMRAWMSHIVRLLGGHPLALVIAGALFREDGFPMEQLVDLLSAYVDPEHPNPYAAMDVSLSAMPDDYTQILYAFGALPLTGTTLDVLLAMTKMQNALGGYRALAFLEKRGFITQDRRLGEKYVAHPIVWQRMMQTEPHAANHPLGERLRQWVLTHARRYSEDPDQLYRYQEITLYVIDIARRYRYDDIVHKLNMTLSAYFHEYLPSHVVENAPPPRLIGERALAAQQLQRGVDDLGKGDLEAAVQTLTEALKQIRLYGSDHEIAEALVANAHLEDQRQNYPPAVQYLEEAAKLCFDLNAQESLHIIRLALAMVYRKQKRFKDALAVLTHTPDTYAERARIYRDSGQWDLMIQALEQAQTLSPYAKAESYLLAKRYAEALAAIAEEHDSRSAYLRAHIYHVQGSLEEAVRGYILALKTVPRRDPRSVQMWLAMGTAYAAQENFDEAQKAYLQALEIAQTIPENEHSAMDYGLLGQTYALLGALRLLDQDAEKAIDLALKAQTAFGKSDGGSALQRDLADMYRTLGRAYWRLGRKKEAMTAFEEEVNHAQSLDRRDETRIGIALHHLAEAQEANNEHDRAIANYRRALTHKNPDVDPYSYYMTQIALYKLFLRLERYPLAGDVAEAAIRHLDSKRPTDLQHFGYILCSYARLQQHIDQPQRAERTFGRWLSVLAGRSDALSDTTRPFIGLLALMLAVRSLLASQRATEALPLAEVALALAERYYPSTTIAWSTRRDLGSVQLAVGEWEATISTHAPLLYDPVQEDIVTYAIAHEQTGAAHAQMGNYPMALDFLERAKRYQPVPHQQGVIIESIADVYLQMDQTEATISHLQEALALLDQKKAPGDVARVLSKLAMLLKQTERYSEAIQTFEQVLAVLRTLPDIHPLQMIQLYLDLASCHEIIGEYPQAGIAYRNALDLIVEGKVEAIAERRLALEKLAAIQVIMERYDDAIGLYVQACDAVEREGTPLEQGILKTALADTYLKASKSEAALPVYEEALALLNAENEPRERAAALRGYGQVLSLVGRFDEARYVWNEALIITTDAPAIEVALTYRAIGQAFYAQQNYDEAEKSYQDALDYHQAGTPERGETLRLLGVSVLEAGRYADAVVPLQQALEIEKAQPQQITNRIIDTLHQLATAQEYSGNVTGTITTYHEALVYMDKNRQTLAFANDLRHLGRLYTMVARWQEAHKALEEALDLELKYKPRAETRIAQTLEMIALAYRREGLLEKAAETYQRIGSYGSLSKSATEDFQKIQEAILKHKATLAVALESVRVLEKTSKENILDLIYVYALIAKTRAELSQFTESNEAIDKLLTVLEQHASQLSTADERPTYRALAHVFEASQAGSEGDLVEARAHFQMALHDTSDEAMRWVISRGLTSVQR